MTDTEIRQKGMEVLTRELGLVEAERFVTLMLREPFDYTKWQRTLFAGMSVEEISKLAMERRKTREAESGAKDKAK